MLPHSCGKTRATSIRFLVRLTILGLKLAALACANLHGVHTHLGRLRTSVMILSRSASDKFGCKDTQRIELSCSQLGQLGVEL